MPSQPDLFAPPASPDAAAEPETARADVVERWFALTRERLPALARERDWPIREDHCFMRVLLDNSCGGPWRASVQAPAYRHAPLDV
ncbi:MAG: hypothetical protein AAF650_05550, partial [Pseudomonadota bacterium]